MSGSRYRFIDYWHFRFIQSDSKTIHAAEEIISTPEKHLLTQEQLFWAEGGFTGLAIQLGAIGVGMAALSFRKP